MREPNVDRLLKAFKIEKTDRAPNLEILIQSNTLEYIMGKREIRSLYDSVFEDKIMDPIGFVLPVAQRPDPMDLSCILPPKEAMELCYKTGMDVILPLLIWCVKPRERTDVNAGDQDPFIRDWNELDKMPAAPSAKLMVERLVDPYLDSTQGTKIGVGPMVRSVLCNTYETLGLENFMYKLNDDVGLVEHIMDIYMNYSIGLAEELSIRNISLFWLDDDIADNKGFIVGPKYIDKLWMPRTKRILEPIKKKNIPIAWHCCGNLTDVVPLAIELGISALQTFQVNCNDIYTIKEKYGDKICIIGGMDCTKVLLYGTPDEVIKETKEHIDRLSPGYVVGSSHSITNDIPPENYMAMIETAQNYSLID